VVAVSFLFGTIGYIVTLGWLRSGKKDGEIDPDSPYPPNPYSDIALGIQKELHIKPIRDTKLVELSYTSPSPYLAAEIVNTIAREFKKFSTDMRLQTTQQASDFLSDQIATLSQELDERNQALQKYSKERDIFLLNPTESTALNELSQVRQALTDARLERFNKQTVFYGLRAMGVDTIPQFVDNPAIQQLVTDYNRAKSEYESIQKEYGPSHPQYIKAKSRFDSLREDIQHAVDVAEQDYKTALQRENRISADLERQKENVVRTDSNAIQYRLLRDEVDQITTLLSSLREKQQAALVSARLGGLETSNISIIDPGEIPERPITPKKGLNLFLALIFGALGGVGLCFVLEYMDNSVKGPEDVERLAGLPSMGVIPHVPLGDDKKQKKIQLASSLEYSSDKQEQNHLEIEHFELINYHYPKISIAEDYRTVRTSILLSFADNPPRSILVTSAMPKEGKSVTVANLAIAFSQLGERILVVDTDLRKPRLHQIFEIQRQEGLSNFLTGSIAMRDAIQKTNIENIFLMPSGPIPPNPSELLNSKKMHQLMTESTQGFDYIFFDTPPVLAVIDPLIVAAMTDATMFVIKAGITARKPFLNAIAELRKANANIMGVLFNELRITTGDLGFMDYYRYYRYEYYGDGDEKPSAEQK
jgi:capsular exopolysaccharide synthesis family protein